MQRHGRAEPGGLFEHVPKQTASDAFPSRIWHERDVQYANILPRVVDVETPDGSAVEHDDRKRRGGEMVPIVRALQIELHAQEAIQLRRAPADIREFVEAGAGVQLSKERFVVVSFGAKVDAQFRDGYTPTSAMQKFNARFGCMFWCGWPPPVLSMALADIVPEATAAYVALPCLFGAQ